MINLHIGSTEHSPMGSPAPSNETKEKLKPAQKLATEIIAKFNLSQSNDLHTFEKTTNFKNKLIKTIKKIDKADKKNQKIPKKLHENITEIIKEAEEILNHDAKNKNIPYKKEMVLKNMSILEGALNSRWPEPEVKNDKVSHKKQSIKIEDNWIEENYPITRGRAAAIESHSTENRTASVESSKPKSDSAKVKSKKANKEKKAEKTVSNVLDFSFLLDEGVPKENLVRFANLAGNIVGRLEKNFETNKLKTMVSPEFALILLTDYQCDKPDLKVLSEGIFASLDNFEDLMNSEKDLGIKAKIYNILDKFVDDWLENKYSHLKEKKA